MERISMAAEMREAGKGAARRMRTAGRIPAVLYGRAVKPLAISVDGREVEKAVKTKAGMNILIDLSIKGGDSGLALIRDFQADPFRRKFTHMDFQAISLAEQIDVEVPVVLTGQSAGVKEGGIVEQSRRSLHIRSLPEAIPERIEIDITNLNIGDSIHADEIALPQGVAFPHAMNYTIVTIVPPTKEEVAAPAAVAPEAVAEGAAPAEGAALRSTQGAAPAAGGQAKGGEEKKESKEPKQAKA